MKHADTDTQPGGNAAAPRQPSRLGRWFSRKNIITIAVIVLLLDLVLTHYLFTSRQRRLFLAVAAQTATEAGAAATLGDLTAFDWQQASIIPNADGGGRFWFCTYGAKTYLFDYILDYGAAEITPETDPATVYTPQSPVTLTRTPGGVRIRPR